MKILSVVGARPQFIKEAIVGESLRHAGITEVLVNTGQHYDANMSEVFFEGLSMKNPDYNLGIGSGSHAVQTGMAMIRLEEVIQKETPDMVLVYGDTNATLAGAITSAKLRIPVAHVEAGLRQHPKDMPEEINRVVTDHVSSLLFCPTEKAVSNLAHEGVRNGVHFVGDVMFDLFLKMKEKLDLSGTLQRFNLREKGYILTTVHRDFNTDVPSRLMEILSALDEIAKDVPVVMPLHPRTRKAIAANGYESLTCRVKIVDPLGYQDMMALLLGSSKVITDSGGLQKEAYFAGVRALVLMPDTAWIELVETGWNILVDADTKKILENVPGEEKRNSSCVGLYGDGNAGAQITKILKQSSF